MSDMEAHLDERFTVFSGAGGVKGHWVSIKGFDRVPSVRSLCEMYCAIRRSGVRRIICHSTGGILAGLVVKVLSPSIVFLPVYHGLASRYEGRLVRLIERVAYRVADTPVFLTEIDRMLLGTRGVVIPNYAPLKQFSGEVARGRIVCVGRPGKQKNIEAFVAAACAMPDRPFTLYCSADRNDVAASMGNLPANLSIDRSENMAEMYRGALAFVLPTFSEGFPLSVLEAAAYGVPLVISDIPVLRHIFGDSAIYFSNEKPEQLIDALCRLSSDEALRAEWAHKGLALLEEYALSKWVQRWNELLMRP